MQNTSTELDIETFFLRHPAIYEYFKFTLVYHLLEERNFLSWRRRRLVQIEAIDDFSYKERTTFQFHFKSDIIQQHISNFFKLLVIPYLEQFKLRRSIDDIHGVKYKRISDVNGLELDIYIPVDDYPKRTLMSFDLHDHKNSSLILLDRFRTTAVQLYALVSPRLKSMGAESLITKSESILAAMIFQAPNDLKSLLNDLGIKKTYHHGSDLLTKLYSREKVEKLMTKLLERYFPGDANFLTPYREEIDDISSLIRECCVKLDMEELDKDPCLNVFMLALDYFKTAPIHSPHVHLPQDSVILLKGFFRDAHAYLKEFIQLKEPLKIFKYLSFYVNNYYLLVPMRIKVGEKILIKTEQLLALRSRENIVKRLWMRSKRFLQPQIKQLYTIKKFGMEASQHYEVKCHDPSEVEIIRKQSFIKIGGKELRSALFFGYSSSYTPHTQHLYTTKTKWEVEEICKKAGMPEGKISDVHLGITYRIDSGIVWTYRVGVVALFLSMVILFFKYDPNSTKSSLHLFIPFILSIIILSLRFRTKEKLVADYFVIYKIFIRSFIWIIIFYSTLQVFRPNMFNPKKMFSLVNEFLWQLLAILGKIIS